MNETPGSYRDLPSVHELLEAPGVAERAEAGEIPRELLREAARDLIAEWRGLIGAGELAGPDVRDVVESAPERLIERALAALRPHLRSAVNATGVIVHTNMGRAPWSDRAAERVAELTRGYVNLEMDLATGARGGRDAAVARLIERLLPGCGVAVVNNCAAAVLLVLNTFGQGKEVVVSRGQLVEIGGSFRIPDVMAKGFATLREVGTTNRTRIDDFREAIGPETGLLMAVHPSNYRVVGFTEEVPLARLAALGAEHGIPVVEDQGSGTLVDLTAYGIEDEPTVADRIEAGADLVTFSGDKLLGGPQAGFIVGRPELIGAVKKNSLYRALRLDKAMMLALEATLAAYVGGDPESIPVLAMLARPVEELQREADGLAEALRDGVEEAGGALEVVESEARVGGGAAPGVGVESRAVAITLPAGVAALAAALREGEPAIVGRVADDRLLLDARTLRDGDAERIAKALAAALPADA